MKKVAVLGHFAFHREVVNGQTVKTKIITTELEQQLGEEQVLKVDTSGRWLFLLRLPWAVFRMLLEARNVIIMPAFKAIALITPMLVLQNLFFRRRLHFVAIGGRLPKMLNRFRFLKLCMLAFDGIYVESTLVANEMKALGVKKVVVMPNCKPLKIMQQPERRNLSSGEPVRLCTFSRVIPEKGIADAIATVAMCNERGGGCRFELDIYGQVEDERWFRQLMANQPETIHYRGCVDFTETTEVLSHYFLLLFPTFYPGECFAGTLIDAMAAGVPVVASDWRSNSEFVEEGRTGFIVPVHDVEAMTRIILHATHSPELIQQMRKACITHAAEFLPSAVIRPLVERMA